MRTYIAGPLFSDQDRSKLEEIAALVTKAGFSVYLPHKHGGDLGSVRIPYGRKNVRNTIFRRDVLEIKRANVLVALLDGPDVDSGTAVEMGIAYEIGIPVVGLKTDFYRRNRTLNNMIWGVCEKGRRITFDTKGMMKVLTSLTKDSIHGRHGKKRSSQT